MQYKAFISYGHETDETLISAVQSALQKFARRWYQSQAFRIFRDKTSLSANPALWPSIERELEKSEYFLLFASPKAQRSPWVEKEVGWWLEHRSIETIVIVVSEGELHWDNATGDFNWDKTSCLPRNLQGRYRHEPQYVNLRWTRTQVDLSLRHPQFRAAILDIAAPLHGKPKHELDGEDFRQRRLFRGLAWSGSILLLVLTVVSVVSAMLAYRNANEAERQREIAFAKQLAAQSESVRTERADGLPLSLLLATEAMRRVRLAREVSLEADQALRVALALSPRLLVETGGGEVITFNQDGSQIFAARKDRVIAFDSITGDEVSSFTHESDASSLAFSNSGRFLATQKTGGPVRVWDTAAGEEIASIPEDDLVSAKVSSDGRFVVTLGRPLRNPHPMRLWEILPRNLPRLVREAKKVSSAAFSPDGMQLALGGQFVTLLSLTTGEEKHQPFGGSVLEYSPDGRYLCMSGPLAVWDFAQERASTFFSVGTFQQATVSEGRRYIATVGPFVDSPTNFARVWEGYTGWEVAQMRHPEGVRAAAFSPDGKRLATLGRDGTIRIWETVSRQNTLVLPYHSSVRVSPSGNALAAIVRADSSTLAASEWSFGNVQRSHWFVRRGLKSVHFRPDGQALALTDESGGVALWNLASGQRLATLNLTGQGVTLSDYARYLACRNNLGVAVWDVDQRRVASFPHAETIHALVFSADGTLLATTSGKDKEGIGSPLELRVWDVVRNSALGNAFTLGPPDYRRRFPVGVLALSGSGRYLSATVEIGTIAVWDARTGRLLGKIQSEGNISAVAFSSDEKFIASGSEKSFVSVHSLAGYIQVARMRLEPEKPVGFLSFSPDGKYLLLGGSGILRRSLWRPEDMIEEACASLQGQLSNVALQQFMRIEDKTKPCPNLP